MEVLWRNVQCLSSWCPGYPRARNLRIRSPTPCPLGQGGLPNNLFCIVLGTLIISMLLFTKSEINTTNQSRTKGARWSTREEPKQGPRNYRPHEKTARILAPRKCFASICAHRSTGKALNKFQAYFQHQKWTKNHNQACHFVWTRMMPMWRCSDSLSVLWALLSDLLLRMNTCLHSCACLHLSHGRAKNFKWVLFFPP